MSHAHESNEYHGEKVDVDLSEFVQIYHMYDDEKSYVGQAEVIDSVGNVRGADIREKEHFRAAEKGEVRNCAPLLAAAIAAKGPHAFKTVILETVHKSKAAEREIFWINELNTVEPHGYNKMGGVGDHYTHSPSTKALMRASLKSFGKDAVKRFTVRLERKIVDNCVGWRGFHDGIPKGFFSNTLTEEEKKAKALHYHLTGEHDYDRRIPRARKHKGFNGEIIAQPGVKPNTSDKGKETYRAQHPTRSGLKEKSFHRDKLAEAIEYTKMLIALPDDWTKVPDSLKSKSKPPKPEKDRYLKAKNAKVKTKFVDVGEVYGYSVDITNKDLIDPKAIRLNLKTMDITRSPEENQRAARLVRNSMMKVPLPLD